MALVSFKRGTKPADLTSLSADTLYFFTDTKEIYLGQVRYGSDTASLASDLEDIKEVLGDLLTSDDGTTLPDKIEEIESAIGDIQDWLGDLAEEDSLQDVLDDLKQEIAAAQFTLTAADSSVTIGGTANAKTIKVNVSQDDGNLISLSDSGDGLVATAEDVLEAIQGENANVGKDYTVTVTEGTDSTNTYAKVYEIKQAATGLDAKINIPKDMVVSSGSVEVNADDQHTGTWIKLVLNNNDVIWIAANTLVDTVTANNANDATVVVTVTDGTKIAAELAEGKVAEKHLATALAEKVNHGESAYTALTWGTV